MFWETIQTEEHEEETMRNKIIDLIEIVAFVVIGCMFPLWTGLCIVLLYVFAKYMVMNALGAFEEAEEREVKRCEPNTEKALQTSDSDEEILEGEIAED